MVIGIPFIFREYGTKENPENFKGWELTLIGKIVLGNSNGIDISGFIKGVNGTSKGIALVGGINYSKSVQDFLIQYGTLTNMIEELPENAFALQIGTYNKIGKTYFPFMHIKGIKNLPRLLRNKK